jgi:hypothetical protein
MRGRVSFVMECIAFVWCLETDVVSFTLTYQRLARQ